MRLPKAALRAGKWPWEHFKFLSPRPYVFRFVVNDWPVHTHLPFSPLCVCVCACPRLHNTSLARRRWLWCSDQNRKRLHHRLEGRRFCWIFCMEGQSSLQPPEHKESSSQSVFQVCFLPSKNPWCLTRAESRDVKMLRWRCFQTDF